MTSKGLLFLVALIGFSCVSHAQTQVPNSPNIQNINGDVHVKDEVAHAHPAAPAPTTKEVPAPADQQVAILKAQRSVQSAQLLATDRRQKATDAEQKAEQQDEANLKQALAELNAAVDKARTELKLPANTPFDQMKLAFTPPAK